MKISCDSSIAYEISDHFTFKVPGYQFMPSYRMKIWDGNIRLFNRQTGLLYAGLLTRLQKFLDQMGYSYSFVETGKYKKPDSSKVTPGSVHKMIVDLLKPSYKGKPLVPYEHQTKGIAHGIKNDRALLLSPTGSGKSLMIYVLARHYERIIPKDKKILLVVPTTSLVHQMYADFGDYSVLDKSWDHTKKCHLVMAGRPKTEKSAKVIISTWQSIYKQPKSYFDQYHCVFIDECHLAKADSLKNILEKCHECKYRFGTTGTLDGMKTHQLVIEGLLGPVFSVTSSSELITKELLSDLEIRNILLEYPDEYRKLVKRVKYQDEIDWIVRCKERNIFIKNLCGSIKGNTLVLFNFVDKHGKPLHKMIQDAYPDRKVFYVSGEVKATDRETIRKTTENEDDAIIVASYATFSTGINIQKLHNIVFASPTKSRVRVLQSIGRQLRKHKTKERAILYDIADDLSWKSYKNFSLKHFIERIKIYASEKFKYSINNIVLQMENSDGN